MSVLNDDLLESRLKALKSRIEAACGRSGRDPADVRMVAVTKTFGPETIDAALRAGLGLFGENRVQEAASKIAECGWAEWHLIGHLQRNKVRPALELFSMLHAVDSTRLLEALAAAAAESGLRPPILLEVNVSGEASKFGLAPEDVPAALKASVRLDAPPVVGLMTIPPFSPDSEASRRYFRRLRELRDRWQEESGLALPDLSMGMSGDFEVAIEEGATYIRVGTALFGRRQGWAGRFKASDDE